MDLSSKASPDFFDYGRRIQKKRANSGGVPTNFLFASGTRLFWNGKIRTAYTNCSLNSLKASSKAISNYCELPSNILHCYSFLSKAVYF